MICYDMRWYTMIYYKQYITLCVFSSCFFSAWIIIIIILSEFRHESWRLIHSYSFLSIQMQDHLEKSSTFRIIEYITSNACLKVFWEGFIPIHPQHRSWRGVNKQKNNPMIYTPWNLTNKYPKIDDFFGTCISGFVKKASFWVSLS